MKKTTSICLFTGMIFLLLVMVVYLLFTQQDTCLLYTSDTLKGEGPSDFKEVVFALGAQMLLFAGRADSCEEAVKLMQDSIDSGAALDRCV